MRVYFFERYYGHDRIVYVTWLAKISAWDFFEMRWYGYGLCIWENISRAEQYTRFKEDISKDQEVIVIQKKLLAPETLQVIHRFTRHRFCTYKKAIPLWIQDPEQLASRKPKKLAKKSDTLQTLTVYPNLWAILNDPSIEMSSVTLLHGQSTKKQKAEAFWWIKSWAIRQVVCTYSQMFKQRHNLSSITLIDQHARRYKSQQDPRYHTVDVVKEMAKIYDVELDMTWYSMSEIWQT